MEEEYETEAMKGRLGTIGYVYFLNTPEPTEADKVRASPNELYIGTTSKLFIKSNANFINDQKCFLKLNSSIKSTGSESYIIFSESKDDVSFKQNGNNTKVAMNENNDGVLLESYLNDSFWKLTFSLGDLSANLTKEVSVEFKIELSTDEEILKTFVINYNYVDKRTLPSNTYTYFFKCKKSVQTTLKISHKSTNDSEISLGSKNPNILTLEQYDYITTSK